MSWRGKDIGRLDAPAQVKHLLLAIDQYADRTGWANPGLDQLAADMSKDRRRVQRIRDQAVAGGSLGYKPGLWKKNGGEYLILVSKGGATTTLSEALRVAKRASKGWRFEHPKGGATTHRTSTKFHEDAAPKAPASSLEIPPDAGAVTTNHRVGGQPLATSSVVASGSIVAEVHGEGRQHVVPLAREIRRSNLDLIRRRLLVTFEKEYGRLYPRPRNRPNRLHPAMRTIVRETWVPFADEVAA